MCGEMHIFNYLIDYESLTLEKVMHDKKIQGQ